MFETRLVQDGSEIDNIKVSFCLSVRGKQLIPSHCTRAHHSWCLWFLKILFELEPSLGCPSFYVPMFSRHPKRTKYGGWLTVDVKKIIPRETALARSLLFLFNDPAAVTVTLAADIIATATATAAIKRCIHGSLSAVLIEFPSRKKCLKKYKELRFKFLSDYV